jgi:hypothetical protein
MKRQLIIIVIVLLFLTLGLVFGSPIEFTKQPTHRIATIISGLFIGSTIFFLVRQSFKLQRGLAKKIIVGLVCVVTLPYIFVGLWTIPDAILCSDYRMWKDITLYTNDKGDMVVGQFMEVSGSIYDYRNRTVYKDFNNGIRISLSSSDKKLNGVWTITDIETGIEKTRTLTNGHE